MNPRNVRNYIRRKHQPTLRIERLEGRRLMCSDLSFAALDADLALGNPIRDTVCVGGETVVAPNAATIFGGKVGGSLDAVGEVSRLGGLAGGMDGLDFVGEVSRLRGFTASGRDRAFADIGDHASITGGLAGGIGGDSIFGHRSGEEIPT